MNERQRRFADEYIISGGCGVVYLITNRVNGKKYVGLTTRNPMQRFQEHCKASSLIGKAIRKYGKDNFDLVVLGKADNREDLLVMEIEKIKEYNTFKNGYNQTIGGDGVLQDLFIEVKLNKKQERFVNFVNMDNKKEIDVHNSSDMIKTIMLNLAQVYLICDKKKDKRSVSKTLLKLKKPLLDELLKLGLFDLKELQRWSQWKAAGNYE